MITLEDYLNHWRAEYGNVQVPADELTESLRLSATATVSAINAVLSAFYASGAPGSDRQRSVRSGWRPVAVNAVVPGAAGGSQHQFCRACDVEDNDRTLAAWAVNNEATIKACGIACMEHESWTPTWWHGQTVPVKSGAFRFVPNASRQLVTPLR